MSKLNKGEQLPIHRRILEHVHDAVLFLHDDGKIIEGNKNSFQLLGIPNDVKTINEILDFTLIKGKHEADLTIQVEEHSLHVKSLMLQEGKIAPIYVLIFRGISIHSKSNQNLEHIEQLKMKSKEGFVLFDENKIIDCDRSFARLFNLDILTLKRLSFYDLIKVNQSILKNNQSKQLISFKPDGTKFYLEVVTNKYPIQGTLIQAAIVRDITDRVKNEKTIEFMAYYDELTDLPNKNFFNKVLIDAIDCRKNSKKTLAVYVLDLNYFKKINDTLGFSFGDQLLKAFSLRLKALLDADTFIARMDSDEFLILNTNVKSNVDACEFAKKVTDFFEKPFIINEHEMYITVSVGISLFPNNGNNASDLIIQAGAAMSTINDKYRNNYQLFDKSITEDLKQKLIIETELRRALKENQFRLYYQPQKNVESNKIVGMEALIRWKHPEVGDITPTKFIPLAEKTGLIFEIGDWVLKEACRQNKEWQVQGYHPIIVGVNLSAKQFHQHDLVDKVEKTLAETGLEPKYLELEITESIAMAHEESIIKKLQKLRQIGVKVSIDDFGTGYSSLKYLSLFPISKLKIDKLFINGKQNQNRAIVKSIIHLSHALKMKVIAEGVETNEQLLFLKKEKCDEVQGFYFSKPLPSPQLVHLLTK
ncbi:GGDEF domain-containing protein [Aquibacillus rhizosphaerae]|uniref:GGDEF domain-containing protein n=1 Tax=Aquibacillus rhizosphaerae TaxID=3051431 RepID=A0ABT7L8I8_9BACI|nr:GGDEF domain-containing protein [Aquibacillus sp. LR5S19]MDL4842172.1 GGDEF domain-containing protein [Aquibacillus sp. LR5S19]